MRLFLTWLLCLRCVIAPAQEPAAVKIEAVDAYIKKADHPLIINFWATWCKPCIEEIPSLQMAAEAYKSQGIELIMISLDFSEAFPGEISAFIKKRKLQGTFFWLDETDADHFCPVIDSAWQGSIPATLLINNKTGYRNFYERKIITDELTKAIKAMLE